MHTHDLRYLHPISKNETFLAAGTHTCYIRTVDFEDSRRSRRRQIIQLTQPDEGGMFYVLRATGVKEYWTIHALPDGSRIIRADRHSIRGADNGMHVLGTLVYGPDGRVQRMHMHVYVNRYLTKDNQLIDRDFFGKATYTFHDDHVLIRRHPLKTTHNLAPIHEIDEPQVREMALPRGYQVMFWRITVGMGRVVQAALDAHAAKAGGNVNPTAASYLAISLDDDKPAKYDGIPVFFPENDGGFALHFQPSHLLLPSIAYYRAEPIERTTVYVDGQSVPATRCKVHRMFSNGFGMGYRGVYADNGIMLVGQLA